MREFKPWIGFAFRLIVGGVLVAAGYLKASNPSQAKMAVRAYDVLPISLANNFGMILPWLEVGVGLLLIVGIAIRYSALFSGILMLLFIAAISQAWMRGLSIDCGCFGGGGSVAPQNTQYLPEIARDTCLALISGYLFRYPSTRFALEKVSEADRKQKVG